MGSGGKRLSQDSGTKSALSGHSLPPGAAAAVQDQIQPRTLPIRQRRSCSRNSKSIPRMPVRNTCWANWRGRPRTCPRRSSISPRPRSSNPTSPMPTSGWACRCWPRRIMPEAVAPLEKAVKLQPGNPAGHYSLATAYARTGRKEDADREFALQQKTSGPAGGQGAQPPQ